jgi:CHAD domain-containing protein
MGAPRTSPASVARAYKRRTEALRKLADNLQNNPSSKALHDTRVAARRVQAVCRLLPKETRRSNGYEKFSSSLRAFRRATSQVRDFDTLIETLRTVKASLPEGLVDALSNAREKATTRAMAAAHALSEASMPVIDLRRLGGKRTFKRLSRRTNRRIRVLERLMEQMETEKLEPEELHALRIEAKKLRYLLELVGEHPSELAALEKWQKDLGIIHDLDMAVAYLRGQRRKPSTHAALVELIERRGESYQRLVQGQSKAPKATSGCAGKGRTHASTVNP